MTSWKSFESEAADLAQVVRARIEAHGLAFLATLRADGSPRISGIEPFIHDGELWMGMMDGGRKSADLRRDPRMALHNATIDKNLAEGDVKISGRAVDEADPIAKRTFLVAFKEAAGYGPPEDAAFDLFRVELVDVTTIRPVGDHLVIERWAPGKKITVIKRY